jgi:hypothetical protein
MATHDYVIDNQSASAFRSDLNNVLQAILTQNSSATAPTTATANMIWYDTTNKQLKKRNEAGSAWIVLGTIDEALGTFTQSGERALASQAQAQAGTDNTTVMTPLRAAQAIAALSPSSYTLLGTINTTSGTSQTLSGLTLTSYTALFLEFRNVIPSSSLTNYNLRLDSTTGTQISGNYVGAGGWYGSVTIMLGVGIFTSSLGSSSTLVAVVNPLAGDSTLSTASTSITIALSNNSFSSGSIRVYGVK